MRKVPIGKDMPNSKTISFRLNEDQQAMLDGLLQNSVYDCERGYPKLLRQLIVDEYNRQSDSGHHHRVGELKRGVERVLREEGDKQDMHSFFVHRLFSEIEPLLLLMADPDAVRKEGLPEYENRLIETFSNFVCGMMQTALNKEPTFPGNNLKALERIAEVSKHLKKEVL